MSELHYHYNELGHLNVKGTFLRNGHTVEYDYPGEWKLYLNRDECYLGETFDPSVGYLQSLSDFREANDIYDNLKL